MEQTPAERAFECAQQRYAAEGGRTPYQGYDDLIERLKIAVRDHSPDRHQPSDNRSRYFARNRLNMKGRFRELSAWIAGKGVPNEEDMLNILFALDTLPGANASRNDSAPAPSDPKRAAIKTAVSVMSSMAGLLGEAGIDPQALLAGERMQILGALKRVAKACGIDASFSSGSEPLGQPVTRNDLKKL